MNNKVEKKLRAQRNHRWGRRLFAMLLAMALTVTGTDFSALIQAEETSFPQTGTHGENLTWTYDEAAKTLTIRGEGEMLKDQYLSYAWREKIGMANIKKVVLEEGITSIASRAFSDTNSILEEVVLPESLTIIESTAFEGASKLKTVKLPSRLTEIRAFVFKNTALQSLTIPASVKKIGHNALGSPQLKELIMEAQTPPELYYNCLDDCYYIGRKPVFAWITVPNGSGELYKEAAAWSKYAEYIKEDLPDSLEGNGTEAEPYLIQNVGGFTYFSENHESGKYYRLTRDISLGTNSGEPWIPIGTEEKPFTGILDGDGHTISGLYAGSIHDSDGRTRYNGLFAYNGGTIKNLTVEGTIKGTYNTGGITAVNTGIITGCTSKVIVEGDQRAGGIAASNEAGALIEKCTNYGNVEGGDYVGGIAGGCLKGVVVNNTNNGAVAGSGSVGGIVGNYETIAAKDALLSGNANNGEVTYSGQGNGITGEDYNFAVGGVIGSFNSDPGFEEKDYYRDNHFLKTENVNTNLRAVGTPKDSSANNGDSESPYELPNPGKYFAGEGTAERPYKIENREMLETLRNVVSKGADEAGKHFIITKDIDLKGSGEDPWMPIGTAERPFEGTMDGDGHTISGLYINNGNADGQGLFGVNSGAIKNLRVEGSITGHDSVGGLVGTNTSKGVITGCVTDVAVTGNDHVGGIAGKNEGSIENCTANGTVSGNDYVGGIAGNNGSQGTVNGSVNNGNVSGKGTHKGGIAGENQNSTEGSVTGTYYQNGDVNKGLTGVGGRTDEQSGVVSQKTPIPEPGKAFMGQGTQEKPFQIYTAQELEKIQEVTGTGSGEYKDAVFELMNDINLEGEDWKPIGTAADPFTGKFDGNGHKISGLTVNGDASDDQGFFGVNAGIIQNLTIEGSVTGENNVGGIAGTNTSAGIIRDCISNAEVTGQDNVGGIVGKNEGSVIRCSTKTDGKAESGSGEADKGSVTGKGNNTGGIAGNNEGTIKDSTNNADVTGGSSTGGVAGNNGTAGTVNNGGNNGNVSTSGGDSGSTGALVGKNDNTAGDSVSGAYKKDETTNKDLTGIGGEADTDGIKAVTDGDVGNPTKSFEGSGTAKDPYKIKTEDDLKKLAELVNSGEDQKEVYYKIEAEEGITITEKNKPWTPIGTEEHPFNGTFDGDGKTIKGLEISGDEPKDNQGLFGVNAGTIENLTVEGSVTGKDNVGGIAGTNTEAGTIRDCTADVTVEGQGSVGGIAGKNEGTVTGCTNKGSVTGKENVGGITGTNGIEGKVKDNINSGDVSGENKKTTGAVIGKNENTDPAGITGNYYQKTDEINKDLTGIGGMETDPAGITSGTGPIPDKYFTQQSGTENDPYIIASKKDLEALRDSVNKGNTYKDKYFKITGDISLGGEDDPWTPIGTGKYPFEGTISGEGHTISGLYIDDQAGDNQGLFGVNAGTIEKLIVEGSVTGKSNVGGIAGANTKDGIIKDCTADVTVKGQDNVGGIAGKNEGAVTGCTNKGSVYGKENVGGITGTNGIEGKVKDNINSGDVSGENKQTTGAVIGKNENTDPAGITGNYYQKTDEINKDLTGIGGMGTDPEGITSGSSPAPGGETPGGNNPGGNNPGGNNPGGDNPGGNNPGGDNPGGNNPGGNTPGGNNPGGNTPGGTKPGDVLSGLTPEQKEEVNKIAKELNVPVETAKKLQQMAQELGIDMNVLLLTDRDIINQNSEGDVKGSSFSKLQVKAAKANKNSITVKWNRVKGASGYQIYTAKCGKNNKYKLVKTITKAGTTRCTYKKLKKGTAYKIIVKAYRNVDGKKYTVAASKTVHEVTLGGKKTNAKTVKVNKGKVKIKKGKKFKIKSKIVKVSAKKKLPNHRKVSYESTSNKIATVSKKGVIKGKKKGTCYVYVYAENGIFKKVKVTVK